MLDLSVVNIPKAHEDGYEFEVVLPNGEKTGSFITVYGPESKTVTEYGKRKLKEMLKRERINKGKNKDTELSPEELIEQSIENVVIKIKGWRGIINGKDSKGNPIEVPFDQDTAFDILKNNKWLRDQIVEASEDVENFRC